MDKHMENKNWMSIPQFGGWDHKGQGGATNYSMVFSQARANRKEQKTNIKHPSLGNEREFIAPTHQEDDSVMRKKKVLTYINCCIRP